MTSETPATPAADWEKAIDLYEISTVNVQDVIERVKRAGVESIALKPDVIMEEIYSDYVGETSREGDLLNACLAKLEA